MTHKFANVFELGRNLLKRGGSVQSGQQRPEVSTSEGPLKRRRDALVMALELGQAFGDLIAFAEVVGCENLPLDNGEVDLDLVQPACVNGRVNGHEARVLLLQSFDRACAAV